MFLSAHATTEATRRSSALAFIEIKSSANSSSELHLYECDPQQRLAVPGSRHPEPQPVILSLVRRILSSRLSALIKTNGNRL